MNKSLPFNANTHVPTEKSSVNNNFFYYVSINVNPGLSNNNGLSIAQPVNPNKIPGIQETAQAVQKLSSSLFQSNLSQKLHVDNKPNLRSHITNDQGSGSYPKPISRSKLQENPQGPRSQGFQDRIINIRSSIAELNTKLDILGSEQQLSLRENQDDLAVDLLDYNGEVLQEITSGEMTDIIKKTQSGVGLLIDKNI